MMNKKINRDSIIYKFDDRNMIFCDYRKENIEWTKLP